MWIKKTEKHKDKFQKGSHEEMMLEKTYSTLVFRCLLNPHRTSAKLAPCLRTVNEIVLPCE